MAGRFAIEDDTPTTDRTVSQSRFTIEEEPTVQPQVSAMPDLGNPQMMPSHTRGPLSSARERIFTRPDSTDTRTFQQYDPNAPIARRQLQPLASAIQNPVGTAVSGAMGVAKGATLGLMNKQVEEATAAMPSLGLEPSKLAEGVGEFAGIIAPWEGIAGAVSATFGLANAGRVGRVATQAATGGIVGATEASNTGKDIADEAAKTAAFAGAITGGLELPGAVRESNWWRMLTNKERGLVVQTIDDIKAGLKSQGWHEGRIEAKIARLDPESFQDALKKRMAGEGTPAPESGGDQPSPKPAEKAAEVLKEAAPPVGTNQSQLPAPAEYPPVNTDLMDQIKARRGRYTIEEEQQISDTKPGETAQETQVTKAQEVQDEQKTEVSEEGNTGETGTSQDAVRDSYQNNIAGGSGGNVSAQTGTYSLPSGEREPRRPEDVLSGASGGLRPAIREPNSDVTIGQPGSTHPEIIDANDIGPDHERGFVGPDGEFMTRAEAKDWLKKNDPEMFKAWELESDTPELHSQDLNAAVEKVAEEGAEKAVTPREVTPDEVANINDQITQMRQEAHAITEKIKGVVLPNGVVKGRIGGAKGEVLSKKAEGLFKKANALEDEWYAALAPDKFTPDELNQAAAKGMPILKPSDVPSVQAETVPDKKPAPTNKTTGPRNLLSEIRKAGGINMQSLIDNLDSKEIKGAKGGNRYLRVTGKNGVGLDQMATQMRDLGWQVPLDVDGRVDAKAFAEMVRDQINGQAAIHPDDVDRFTDKRVADAAQDIHHLSDAELDELDYANWTNEERDAYHAGLDAISADLLDELVEPDYNYLSDRIKEVQDAITAVTRDIEGRGEELAEGQPGEGTQRLTEKNEGNGRPAGEVVSTSGEVQNKLFATPPTFGKKPQTGGKATSTSDLLDNFTADKTPDLFASQEVPGETQPERIEDFGEKIGGARKDTAERGYAKAGKTKGEPAPEPWRKKYVAMEKVDGSGWSVGKTGDRFGISAKRAQTFATKEDAEAAIPVYAVAEKHHVYQNKDGTWNIWKKTGERKRIKVVAEDFPSREEAMTYMATHAVDLLNLKTSFGEEILPVPEIAIRKGTERRTGPATPEMFMETFAPRGIEFGNWNNQAERQQVMDHAYDGLLDLAEVLNVPPKALMLNGDLAIAFGARGQGLSGAKAHYERDYAAINLTKMSGAGSLAHEWFHAFDHYMARLDGKAAAERAANDKGNKVFEERGLKRDLQSHGNSFNSKLRPELQQAYKDLIKAMYRKAEKYVEDTEKADKFVATTRENLSESLQSIRNDLTRNLAEDYTWRKNKRGLAPASEEQLSEFDRLANVLVEGGDLETQYRPDNPTAPANSRAAFSGRNTNDTLEGIGAILKAVRNRSGFNADRTGILDRLRTDMSLYSARLKMLKDAESQTEQTRQMPTSFAMEAKKMDQARAGDYWSEPHEMVARAFASYVEDKVAQAGGQSDFLVYHAHGGILLPMIDGFIARPYPEGAERSAINDEFDKLIGTLKTKETERGTALFSLAKREDDVKLNSDDAERIGKIKRGEYVPERLQQKYGEALSEGDLGAAASIARRVQEAVRGGEISGSDSWERRQRYRQLAESEIRPAEEKALREWAEVNNKLIPASDFEQALQERGAKGGQEHKVYLSPDGARVFKANNLSFHDTYLDFFHRLAVHNVEFSGTPYQFEGFTELDGKLQPVISQPWVQGRKATFEESHSNMVNRGFDPVGTSDKPVAYRIPDTDLIIRDVHGDNTRINKAGDIFTIDPVIEHDLDTKVDRLKAEATAAEKAPNLSLSKAKKSGILQADALAAVDPLLKNWKNAPPVDVIQDESQLPADLFDQIRSIGAEGRVRGLFNEGRVHLIADNLRTTDEALETLLHEVVGHYGIRGLMGKDFDPILRDIYELYGKKGLEEIAYRYGLDLNDPEDRKIAAEEKLAEIAQTGERPGFVRRVIGMIKDWLRKMGLDLKWTDEDIKALLDRARGWVERGKGKSAAENVRFSMGKEEPSTSKPTPELVKRYNEFLNRAEEAVKNRNEEAALKWLARADEMERSWTPEPAIKIPGGTQDANNIQRGRQSEQAGEYHPDQGVAEGSGEKPVLPGKDGETADDTQRTTGIKNAVTEEERETKGKNPVEVETRRSFGEAFDRGKEAVDSGQIDPRVLAENLANAPRALSAEESVALIYDRMRLQNDHATVMEQIEKATAAEDTAAVLEGRQRLAKIEDDINTNDEAARRTGYEQGLGLAARKMMIAEDYSLARSVQRLRVATGLPDIPEELRAKIEDLTKQLQEALKKSEVYEEKIRELEAARKVRRMTEELAPVRRAEKRGSSSRKAMDTEFRALSNKLKAKFGVLNIGFDPEDVVVLAEMARNRVIAGITDAKAIVDDIFEELKDLPDLEKRDIRDAISGYGKAYKMTQDEISAELREARRQMRLISALEDAQAGEPPLHSGLQRDPISDEVRDLQRQVKEAMRESGLDAQSMRSPEEQWKTAIDSVKTRLKNEIHDLDQQITAGKRTHKEKSSIEYDEEAKKLKSIRDDKKRLLDEIDARPPKSEDELQKIHLKAYKTRTASRIADLERKLKTGDFEKKARRVLQMDPEDLRLKAEAERIKEAINTEIRKQELANRTAAERGLDWMVKWRRAVILSGSATIGKLTTAASLRQITTPLEELVGGVLSRMPVFSRIAEKAPREGGGLNVRAEAEAMRQWFAKATYMDAWDVIKTGRGELDRMYGKKHDLPPEAIEFFGHVHGALKIMPKRAEFYRSLQKRTEWAIKNGLDVSNPTTQATLFAESYVDANRAIFMQDNAMVTAYRMLINFLRHKGTAGRAGATALQMLMPIVKIPTNFVAETTSYAAGGAKAIGKLIGSKGIGNLTPEEADYVMRALKKQGIGLAMLVMGYLLASEIGGYYERGEKRKASDVKAGGLRILGVDIPRWALHTPVLEVLQIGATLRRVEDHYKEYNEKHPDKPQKQHAIASGLFAGAKGLIEEVPFFEQPVRTGESLRTAESATKFGSQFAESLLVPPDLRKISKSMDKAGDEQIPREQNTLLQMLQGDIPGQRKKLPLDMKRIERMQIDQMANIMEQAPSYVVDEIKPVFRKKFRNSKGLEPEERRRYLDILRSE